jgi:hypothetical protein
MSIKSRNKECQACLMTAAACIAVVALWAVLAVPGAALAKKPGGGGGTPEVLHGNATFRDATGDTVQSDGGGIYSDAVDGTVLGLQEFFRLSLKLKKNGGRSLNLDFTGQSIEPGFLPASQNIWILWVKGNLTDWRGQDIGMPVLRQGNLLFGQTGKDEADVSYGRWGGSYLTVTRTGADVWTIESLPTDEAVFYRHDVAREFGSGPMPFRVTYSGQ